MGFAKMHKPAADGMATISVMRRESMEIRLISRFSFFAIAPESIGVVYVLCGIPEINAMGSAVGTFVSYLVMIILNLIALHRMLPEIPSVVRMGIRPLLASVIMGAVSYPVYLLLTRFMSEKFAVIPVILLAILVYLVAAVFTKAITREEIVQLPKGEKLADKLHLK